MRLASMLTLVAFASACGYASAAGPTTVPDDPKATEEEDGTVSAHDVTDGAECLMTFEQASSSPGVAHLEVRFLTTGCGVRPAYFNTEPDTYVVFINRSSMDPPAPVVTINPRVRQRIQYRAAKPGTYWIQARTEFGGGPVTLMAVIP